MNIAKRIFQNDEISAAMARQVSRVAKRENTMSVNMLFEAKAIIHDYSQSVERIEDRINERLEEMRPKPARTPLL